MPFTTPIWLQVPTDESGTLNWKTLEALNFWSNQYQRNFVVPKDFETDLASVPHDLLAWAVGGGRGNAGAVLHDWLYRNGYAHKQIYKREQADNLFYEAMLDCKVPKWRAWLMYWAVRMFGKKAFKGKVG